MRLTPKSAQNLHSALSSGKPDHAQSEPKSSKEEAYPECDEQRQTLSRLPQSHRRKCKTNSLVRSPEEERCLHVTESRQ